MAMALMCRTNIGEKSAAQKNTGCFLHYLLFGLEAKYIYLLWVKLGLPISYVSSNSIDLLHFVKMMLTWNFSA